MASKPSTRRVGRPMTVATEGEKATLGIRAAPDLKSKLMDAAKRNGRSLSAEAEFRLEQSFRSEAMLDDAWSLAYGFSGRDLMKLIGCAIRLAPTVDADWINDPAQYAMVAASLIALLDEAPLRPAGEVDLQVARTLGVRMIEPVLRRARGDVIAASHGSFSETASQRIYRWLSKVERHPDAEAAR